MPKTDRYVAWALVMGWGAALWAAPVAGQVDHRLADAARNQDKREIRVLVQAHADVNGSGADRTTALMWAAHFGDQESVELLIKAGADVKALNRYHSSALSEAAEIANVPIIEDLLKAGADANTVSQNDESVLMTAAHGGSVEAVKLLLDHGADINARTLKDEETPLMYAVFDGHLPVVKLLISRGADVNAVAHTLDLPRRQQPAAAIFASRIAGGFSALTFAARQDYSEIARALLDAGANPNVEDRDGMTPMIVAAINGSFETAAVLLQKGADPNDGTLWETMEFRNYKGDDENGRVLPEITSKLDAVSFEKMLLEHGADPTKPYGKQRTLHKYAGTRLMRPESTSGLDRAMDSLDVESVRLMLEAASARGVKFDPGAVLTDAIRAYPIIGPGKMIFRTATPQDAAAIVNIALGYGADVNAANTLGNTPLHLAAQFGADDIINILAAKGAKLDAKNKAGLTPMDIATGEGDAENRRGASGDHPEHESTAALLRQLMGGPTARNAAPAASSN